MPIVEPWCGQTIENAEKVELPVLTSTVGAPLPPSTRATPLTLARAGKLDSFTEIGPP